MIADVGLIDVFGCNLNSLLLLIPVHLHILLMFFSIISEAFLNTKGLYSLSAIVAYICKYSM